jgi:hypothetical protein
MAYDQEQQLAQLTADIAKANDKIVTLSFSKELPKPPPNCTPGVPGLVYDAGQDLLTQMFGHLRDCGQVGDSLWAVLPRVSARDAAELGLPKSPKRQSVNLGNASHIGFALPAPKPAEERVTPPARESNPVAAEVSPAKAARDRLKEALAEVRETELAIRGPCPGGCGEPPSMCKCPEEVHDGEDGCGLPLSECQCDDEPSLGEILARKLLIGEGDEPALIDDIVESTNDFIRAGAERVRHGKMPPKTTPATNKAKGSAFEVVTTSAAATDPKKGAA